MPYPQLPGRSATNVPNSPRKSILWFVLALATGLAVLGWRLILNSTPRPAIAVVASPVPAAEITRPEFSASEDDRLRLEHAEQLLLTAAEHLSAARRGLAALSPELYRHYLQHEKRRADNAWTACNAAARLIEQARDDIKTIADKRKD
jgi:CRP-like cAMP-binding protein